MHKDVLHNSGPSYANSRKQDLWYVAVWASSKLGLSYVKKKKNLSRSFSEHNTET